MAQLISKNLFNLPLLGVVSEEIGELEAKMMAEMTEKEEEEFTAMMVAMEGDDDNAFLESMRSMTDSATKSMMCHSVFTHAAENTVVTEITVPTTHDGNYDVHVFVHTPKSLEGKSGRAAYVYAHGGGAIASCAVDSKPWMNHYAVSWDVVCFNVEYRLAPETKCPNNAKDFYETIKYIHTNASSLGVDPNKICIAGDSGGGYICLSAMVLLAQRDETALVKLAIPGIPMVDDYCFSDPANMTQEESENAPTMRRIWKLIAADLETQRSDPLLFPGKASDELLAKFPPTIIRESEFDMYITEATRLATRLRRVGRLLELVVVPGAKHGSCLMPDLGCFAQYIDIMKTIVNEYLEK